MDFFELVNRRRSVRKFTDKKVPEEIIKKCLRASVLAPNSSNLQPWEFYWIRNHKKKEQVVEACFSQNAAKTAKEIVIAVSRIDSWKRNRDLIIKDYKTRDKLIPLVDRYYHRIIPFAYTHDRLGVIGVLKKIIFVFLNLYGYFKPIPRGPIFKHQLFESVTKSTALACQNFMMALVAEGFDSCPMEGFDEKRIKKLLKLNWQSHVVMIFGIGEAEENGIYSERFRVDESLVIKEI